MLQSGIDYRTAILQTACAVQGKFLLSAVMFVIIHAPTAASYVRDGAFPALAASPACGRADMLGRIPLGHGQVRKSGARSFGSARKRTKMRLSLWAKAATEILGD
jgi:hypothetical protein